MNSPTSNVSSTGWHLRLSLACLGLMMVFPFLPAHHRHPIPTFYQEIIAAWLGLFAITWLLNRQIRQQIDLPRICLLPIGLLAILVLQLLFNDSVNPERLMLFALFLIWATLLAILGRQIAAVAGLDTLIRWLAVGCLASGLLQCLTAALQLAGTPGPPWIAPFNGALTGNLAQRNSFSNALWLAIASAVHMRSTGFLRWPAALSSLIILTFFASFSGSRSIWLYALALPLLTLVTSWRHAGLATQWRSFLKWSLLTLGILLLLRAALASGIFAPPDYWPQDSGARLAESGASDPIRLALWKSAWSIFADHPLLGSGIGQFTWQFHEHVLQLMPMHLPGLPEHAHNLLLHLMAEMGAGAALLLVISGLIWLRSLWQQAWQAGHWWLMAILSLLLIHGTFEYPLWYAFFLGPFALLLGAGDQQPLSLSIQRIFTPLLLCALLLGSTTLITLQRDYGVLEEAVNHRSDASDTDSFQRRYAGKLQRIASNSLLSPYVLMVAGNLQEDNAADLEHKRTLCRHALRFAATRQIVFKCAHLEALSGNMAAARLALSKALAAYPDHAAIVRREWQERQAREPELQRLLADFPANPSATPSTSR